jgi:thiol-disulfide isomerase/thioredoxin
MPLRQKIDKSIYKKAGNYIFLGLLLVLLFNPNAKAWLLRQVMSTGLFNAGIKKEATAVNKTNSLANFSYRDEKGNVLSTVNLKGKVVFINFWATWCPPCRAEMPALNDLYNKLHADDRFVFLFLNEDNDPQKAASYLQSNGFAMPLLSSSGSVPSEIYSGSLPTTIVLNKDGQIVYKHEGIAKYNTTEFIQQLKDLL